MRKILVGLGFFIITCATLLLSEGVPVKVVQEVRRPHQRLRNMDVYAHVLPDMQEKAAAAMDGLLPDHR